MIVAQWFGNRSTLLFDRQQITFLFGLLCLGMIIGDQTWAANPSAYINPVRLPWYQRGIVDAAGERVRKPGKDRQVYTGTFERTVDGQLIRSNVLITVDLPRKVRIDDLSRQETIESDRGTTKKSKGTLSKADEELIEALLLDSVEGFLLTQADGEQASLVSRQSRIQDSRMQNGLAGICDVYSISTAPRSRSELPATLKMYYVDSATQLLRSTIRYEGPVAIETRFSNWQRSGTEAYPSQITRVDGSGVAWTLQLTSQRVEPRPAGQ